MQGHGRRSQDDLHVRRHADLHGNPALHIDALVHRPGRDGERRVPRLRAAQVAGVRDFQHIRRAAGPGQRDTRDRLPLGVDGGGGKREVARVRDRLRGVDVDLRRLLVRATGEPEHERQDERCEREGSHAQLLSRTTDASGR